MKEWVNKATLSDTILQEEASNNDRDNAFGSDEDSSTLGGGFTALHYASYHGNHRMIDMLVSLGADVYAVNEQGINMVHVAA